MKPVLALVLIVSTLACAGSQAPVDALVLTYDGSTTLPQGFDPGGIATAPDGRHLVWDTGDPRALVIDSMRVVTMLDLPWHTPFAKMWWSDVAQTWHGFSAASSSVVELTPDLGFKGSFSFGEWAESVEILDMTEAAGQLWLTWRDDHGRVDVAQFVRPGVRLTSALTFEERPTVADTAARLTLHLTNASQTPTVNHMWSPFDVIPSVADGHGRRWRVLAQIKKAPALSRDIRRSLAEQPWAALPIVRLDRGWLLTIADLQGDRRVLARLDRNGVLVSTVMLDAAIGFAGSDVERQSLTAMERDLAGAAIHWFTWRWAPPT